MAFKSFLKDICITVQVQFKLVQLWVVYKKMDIIRIQYLLYQSTQSNYFELTDIFFFISQVQSLCVGATGIVGILTYNFTSVETVRMKNLSWLTAMNACIQLFVALICFTPKCKYDISSKVLLFMVSFEKILTMFHFN